MHGKSPPLSGLIHDMLLNTKVQGLSNWLQIQTMINRERVMGDSSVGDPISIH